MVPVARHEALRAAQVRGAAAAARGSRRACSPGLEAAGGLTTRTCRVAHGMHGGEQSPLEAVRAPRLVLH